MENQPIDFTIDGVPFRILDECDEFIVAQNLQTKEIAGQPNGLANEALKKAIYGTKDQGADESSLPDSELLRRDANAIENRERDEMCGRILRASALERLYEEYHSIKTGRNPVHGDRATELVTDLARAIGPILSKALQMKKREKAIHHVRDAFATAMRCLLNNRSLDYPELASKHTRRVLMAMEIGRVYFLKNREQPSKKLIQDELVRQGLDFGQTTVSKKNELWTLFWRENGLEDLPDN